jgi:hypothetical protein
MKRRSLAAVLIAALVLTLTGCLRYNSIYYIQSDGTVSGQVYTALKEGYQVDSDPYKGTGAGDIAALFPGATITDVTAAPWYAYMVSFSNAPLSSFAAVPSAGWQAQITKAGGVYKVLGYNTDGTTAETRNAILTNDGYSYLQVGFPGALKDGGNATGSGTSSGAGWADWDLMNMTGEPHAEGYTGALFLDPGFFHLDPTLIGPAPVVTPAPAPAPVVTVVITPSAAPAPAPSPSASGGATPSPTLTTIAAPSSGGSGGVPLAVWIVLAALVVALVGVGSFLLAQRGRGAGVAAAVAGGSGDAVPPASGASGAATTPAAGETAPAAGDVADTVVMKAVEPTPAEPTPAATPKELPPDVV